MPRGSGFGPHVYGDLSAQPLYNASLHIKNNVGSNEHLASSVPEICYVPDLRYSLVFGSDKPKLSKDSGPSRCPLT